MDIYTYLFPNEQIAQIIIIIQVVFFLYWMISRQLQKRRLKKISFEIKSCEEIDELSEILGKRYEQNRDSTAEEIIVDSTHEAASSFENFCNNDSRQISTNSPLYEHLRAIFFTGFNESQLNVETLIKNTTSRIVAHNTILRYFISIFIILGLLGTLFGLASSLHELSAILFNTEQFNDEALKNGLKILLGKLSGAFTPSILGVIFTVIGMWLFARYLNKYSFPVLHALEHQTLTNWVPNLIPTPSQRILDKLHLGEKQVTEMAEFTSKVSGETNELRKNIKDASSTLRGLNKTAAKLGNFTESFTQNLDKFAQDFKDSVDKLSPVTEGLAELYQKILEDSQKFQESVGQTLEDSQTFRSQVQAEFGQQSNQLTTLFNSMKLYETAYLENRQSTDEKVQATLSSAQQALDSLSKQNEVFVKELIDVVGKPLREELKAELVNVTGALNQIQSDSNTSLSELSQNIGSELQSVATRLGQLENPLKNSMESIEATSTNFVTSADNSLKKIRDEFQGQNEQKQLEISSMKNLNDGIQKLVGEIGVLTRKIGKINQTSKPTVRLRPKVPDDRPDYFPEPKPGFFRRIVKRFRRKENRDGR